jgi:hypothetical protein
MEDNMDGDGYMPLPDSTERLTVVELGMVFDNGPLLEIKLWNDQAGKLEGAWRMSLWYFHECTGLKECCFSSIEGRKADVTFMNYHVGSKLIRRIELESSPEV